MRPALPPAFPGPARHAPARRTWLRAASALFAATLPGLALASDTAAQSQRLERARRAVLGLRVQAVEGARSAATLGRLRSGSGVLIDRDLVLTIGYLVLEAEQVMLLLDDGRPVPARALAYDLATGFALVQALAPLAIEPVPLGRPQDLAAGQPLMAATGGDDGEVAVARLSARRPFAGYWEYLIDGALFTSPPIDDHSGAGLFDAEGRLLGIGSLRVADVDEPGRHGAPARRAGNMFVPVDLLQPILGELKSRGQSAASRRAWLGLNCGEIDGRVRVLRVTTDSPADVAGLEPGDEIVGIDDAPVQDLPGLWRALWSGGAPERAVKLLIRRGEAQQALVVHSVDRMLTLKRPEGI